MNKELIKKYKNEFDHWLNEGSVLLGIRDLVKSTIKWYPSVTDPFEEESTSGELLVIINDDYCTYRKALAEGKTVQANINYWANTETTEFNWQNIESQDSISKFNLPNLRIKPEHEFKVGDWLHDVQCKTYHRINKVLLDRVELNGFNVLYLAISDYNYKLWKPKPGEWCIMDSEPATDRYSFTVQKWTENSKWTPIPYTGPLPHFIKD